MKQAYLALALLLAGTLGAQAQVRSSIGPQLGYTLFTADYHDDNYQNTTDYRSNFAAGVLAEFGVGHLTVQAAPRYSRKGYSIQQVPLSGISITTGRRLDYVVLPLSIGYTQHRDGQGFQVFAGAYLGYFVTGHFQNQFTVNGTPTTQSGSLYSDKNSGLPGFIRRLDWGVQGGVGYRYQQQLLQVEYQAGLQNADSNNSSGGYVLNGGNYYNRGFQLSLAYLFGSKS